MGNVEAGIEGPQALGDPFFTVIIPTYNRAALVTEAIQSVLHQRFANFEIIVVDNGSCDDTQERISKLSDSRIRYYWQEGSGSPANPRNRGIDLARGQWVAFLDSDDLWLPGKLDAVAQLARSDQYEGISHWQALADLNGKWIRVKRTEPSGPLTYRRLLLTENTFATSAVALRRQFLLDKELRFSERDDLIAVEDYDLWLNVVRENGRFGFIREALGVNREHEQSTGNLDLFFANLRTLLSEHALRIQSFTEHKESLQNRLFAGLAMRQAMASLRSSSFTSSAHFFMRSVRFDALEPLRYAFYRARRRAEWSFLALRSSPSGSHYR